jgi:exonuclease SbcD
MPSICMRRRRGAWPGRFGGSQTTVPSSCCKGTFSHEPPGTLVDVFRLLGGRFPIHVADRIQQVALTTGRSHWVESAGWRFAAAGGWGRALFSCLPTVNKAT